MSGADACARCGAEPSSSETADMPRYAPSRTLAIESPEAEPRSDRWSVRRIGRDSASDDAAPRPGRARKVDIDLVRAPFEDVARFLGDTGRFNVVVEAPSARPVTVKLRDIEPYDALVAIAEVQGIGVTYRRGVVIVSNGAK